MSPASSVHTGPVIIIAGQNQLWNTQCTLSLYLASRHDAAFNYVTFNVNEAVINGFFPGGNPEQFRKSFSQGDIFTLILDGRLMVSARVNRKTCDTIAFTCPRSIEMPTWNTDTGGSRIVAVKALVVGYTGFRLIPKERKVQPKQAPETATVQVPPHLDPILETPAESASRSPYPNPPRVRPQAAPDEAQFLVVGKGIKVYRLTAAG